MNYVMMDRKDGELKIRKQIKFGDYVTLNVDNYRWIGIVIYIDAVFLCTVLWQDNETSVHHIDDLVKVG